MTDDEPTEEELREAETLARALDSGAGAPPDDALETAALLRYAGPEGQLDETRSAALLDEIFRDAKMPAPAPSAGQRLWLWLFGGVGATLVTGAAALLLVFLSRSPNASPSMAPSAEPMATADQALDQEAAEASERAIPGMDPAGYALSETEEAEALAEGMPAEEPSSLELAASLRDPVPSPELLAAQARAAQGGAGELSALANEMRGYRGVLLASLDQRYGAR